VIQYDKSGFQKLGEMTMMEISDIEQMTELDATSRDYLTRAIEAWVAHIVTIPSAVALSDEELTVAQTMFLSGYVAALRGM